MRKLLTLSLVLVLVDQATKLAVKGFNLFGIHHEGMRLGESISVLGDFLRFTFVENPGMAFGINLGLPIILGLFSIGAAVFLVYLLRRSKGGKIHGFHVALATILGGAVGNLIDRVFYGLFYGYGSLFDGKVVDFVDVDIPNIDIGSLHLDRFYVFNIADAAVSIGLVLLLFFYPRYQKEQEAALAASTQGQDQPEGVSGAAGGQAAPISNNGNFADGEEKNSSEKIQDGETSFPADSEENNTAG